MNVLFICTRNRKRSPTAEAVFASYPGIETASAGTNSDSDVPLDADLIRWADLICLMEAEHKRKMTTKFSPYLKGKRVAVLGIPDDYEFMDPALVSILERKVTSMLTGAGRPEPRQRPE